MNMIVKSASDIVAGDVIAAPYVGLVVQVVEDLDDPDYGRCIRIGGRWGDGHLRFYTTPESRFTMG